MAKSPVSRFRDHFRNFENALAQSSGVKPYISELTRRDAREGSPEWAYDEYETPRTEVLSDFIRNFAIQKRDGQRVEVGFSFFYEDISEDEVSVVIKTEYHQQYKKPTFSDHDKQKPDFVEYSSGYSMSEFKDLIKQVTRNLKKEDLLSTNQVFGILKDLFISNNPSKMNNSKEEIKNFLSQKSDERVSISKRASETKEKVEQAKYSIKEEFENSTEFKEFNKLEAMLNRAKEKMENKRQEITDKHDLKNKEILMNKAQSDLDEFDLSVDKTKKVMRKRGMYS